MCSRRQEGALHADRVAELEESAARACSAQLHEQYPLMTTHDRQRVLSQLDYVGDEGILQGITDRLLKPKKLVGDAAPDRPGRLQAEAERQPAEAQGPDCGRHRGRGVSAAGPGRASPPKSGGNAASLKDIYEVAVAEGLLVRVTDEIYLHADVEADMQGRLKEKLPAAPGRRSRRSATCWARPANTRCRCASTSTASA